jgi:MFS family permease
MSTRSRVRWVALAVVCAGSLMNALDTTIVSVALPAIQHDLGFSQASLAWVVNAYLLTYGGFLVLGGRLGDLFGHRRLFAAAIGVFTLASLACGLAPGQEFLLAARAVQGLAGAVASAVALSLVVSLFPEPGERAKAMGVFGFVIAGGGSIGVLAGGVLTGLLSWHWIFWVNVPIGAVVFLASLRVLPAGPARQRGRLDVVGAGLVTAGMMLAVYAISGVSQTGWASSRTIALLAATAVLLATGHSHPTALAGGYHAAFLAGAACAALAAVLAARWLRPAFPLARPGAVAPAAEPALQTAGVPGKDGTRTRAVFRESAK